MSRALDTYRTLDGPEKERFRTACRDDEVNPRTMCPLCRGRRLTTEPRYGYCDLHKSWEMERPQSLGVACHNCKVKWAVLLHKPCSPEQAPEPSHA